MYSMSTDLSVKILFLIAAICGMIVAYRLAWDQRTERDQLHTYTFVRFSFTPCMPTERHLIFARRPTSLVTGVRAMHIHRKAFNICWETHKSGHGSESNAQPDTWRGDGVAFASSLQTSSLHSLILRGCHGDFEQRKLDTYLSFYDIQQQIWDVQVLVLLRTCCSLTFLTVLNDTFWFSCICT